MAAEDRVDSKMIEEAWRAYFTTGKLPDYVGAPWYTSRRLRRLYRRMPAEPRCRLCYYPFHGIGGGDGETCFRDQTLQAEPTPVQPV